MKLIKIGAASQNTRSDDKMRVPNQSRYSNCVEQELESDSSHFRFIQEEHKKTR